MDDEIEIHVPPTDVVPRSEITPLAADLLRSAVGQQIEMHWPGEVEDGEDGVPDSMTAPRTLTAILASVHLSKEENPDDHTD